VTRWWWVTKQTSSWFFRIADSSGVAGFKMKCLWGCPYSRQSVYPGYVSLDLVFTRYVTLEMDTSFSYGCGRWQSPWDQETLPGRTAKSEGMACFGDSTTTGGCTARATYFSRMGRQLLQEVGISREGAWLSCDDMIRTNGVHSVFSMGLLRSGSPRKALPV
jgi:hypothetical protein